MNRPRSLIFGQGFNYFENGIYKKAYQHFFKRAAVTNNIKAL